MCSLGYTVSNSETNPFWASDLLHRLFHMPAIGQSWVDHFAEGYEEVVELAAANGSLATRNSETLQYFALEVYAFDVVVPGVGCLGEYEHGHEHESNGDGGDSPEVSYFFRRGRSVTDVFRIVTRMREERCIALS